MYPPEGEAMPMASSLMGKPGVPLPTIPWPSLMRVEETWCHLKFLLSLDPKDAPEHESAADRPGEIDGTRIGK